MVGKEKNIRMRIIKSNRHNFYQIFNLVDISAEDLAKPMTANFANPFDDPVTGLLNPYSRATSLILYLYSMELGSPQLYSEVNRVARDMDLTYL